MDLLNLLLCAIALAFASIVLMDFTGGLMKLWAASAPKAAIPPQAKAQQFLSAPREKEPEPATIDDPWLQVIAIRKRPTWASIGQINNFEIQSLLPPAPTATDIEALGWENIKNLAKGRVPKWNRMKKQQLIQAIAEAQITRNDLAQARAA